MPLAVRLKAIHCAAKRAYTGSAADARHDRVALGIRSSGLDRSGAVARGGSAQRRSCTHVRQAHRYAAMPEPFAGMHCGTRSSAALRSDPQKAESLIPKLLAYQGDDPPAPMLWGKAIECVACRSHVEGADVESIWDKLPLPIVDETAGVLMQAAFTLECRGHLDAARLSYERLASMEGVPEAVLVNARLRLGIVLDALGLWDLAVREYEAASRIQCEPNVVQSQAVFRLAQAREMAEEYSEAVGLFAGLRADTLLDQPQRTQAQLRYAMCLLKVGDKERALVELETCRQAGGDASLKADMALAEIHESSRNAAEARACYERVLANPAAEPLTKSAALTRLQRLRR